MSRFPAFWFLTCCLVVALPSSIRGEPIRTDRYGDPLPPGAYARLGSIRWRQPRGVSVVALSADGRLVASAGYGNDIYLWEAPAGRLRARLIGHNQSPSTLAFSPDGKVLATASLLGESTGQVRLWDTTTGKQRAFLPAATHRVALAFSPDGRLLAGGSPSDGLCIWEVATGKEVGTIADRTCGGRALAFSSDGKTLASGGKGPLLLFDVATGRKRPQLAGHRDGVTSVTFSPDGRTLASAGHDGFIRFWDARSGKELERVAKGKDSTDRIAFAGDSRTVVADVGGRVLRRWDWITRTELSHWRDEEYAIACVSFSADGRFTALGSIGGPSAVRLIDLARGMEVTTLKGHRGPVNSVAFSPGGQTIATSSEESGEGAVRLWDPGSARECYRLPGGDGVNSVAFSRNGRILFWQGTDASIHFWDRSTRKEVLRRAIPRRSFVTFGRVCLSSEFGPDKLVLLTQSIREAAFQLVDAATWKRLRRFIPKDRESIVVGAALSRDDRVLATVLVEPWNGRRGPLSCNVTFWDVRTGKVIRRRIIHRADTIAFSPDGKWLALSRGYQILLLEVATCREVVTIETTHEVPIPVFSADGRMLISCGIGPRTGSMVVWEVATGRERLRFPDPRTSDNVIPETFSPDHRTLATGCEDGTTLLWDLTGHGSPGRKLLRLSPRDLEARWTDLAGADAARAYRSIWALALRPVQAVALLKERLHPATAPSPQRIARLLTDLDDDNYDVRQAAMAELQRASDLVRPALERTRKSRPPLEVRRRVEQLLKRLDNPFLSPQRLRMIRALEVLENAGTPEARRLLERFARGAPESRLAREARASLERLAGRGQKEPGLIRLPGAETPQPARTRGRR